MATHIMRLSVADAATFMADRERENLEHRRLCPAGSMCTPPVSLRGFQSSDDPTHVIVLSEGDWTPEQLDAWRTCPNRQAIWDHAESGGARHVDFEHDNHHVGEFVEIWAATFP
ncbi:MAG: hypothetical protein F2842_10940 [Actinobacteria bacterium]|uniref:Unannotated protein n=1 Tax=freshwater metagenome TaxID=449393 RepID=A0A6J7L8I9_9ZZZZ|nr:hypothetical protein [Actinomycetota bacterium]